MAEERDWTRESWLRLSPEQRDKLADLAFMSKTLTPEMQTVLQDNALRDVIEEQGEKD